MFLPSVSRFCASMNASLKLVLPQRDLPDILVVLLLCVKITILSDKIQKSSTSVLGIDAADFYFVVLGLIFRADWTD